MRTKRNKLWMLGLAIALIMPCLTACSSEASSGTPIVLMLLTIIGLMAIIGVLFVKTLKKDAELIVQQKQREKDLEAQKCQSEQEKKQAEQDIGYLGEVIQSLLKTYDDDMNAKSSEIEEIQRLSAVSNSELVKMKDRLARLQKLHPDMNFEQEIQEMKEAEWKKQAEELDEKITAVIDTPADKLNVAFFAEAVTMYERADINVKKYMISDIAKLNSLLEQSRIMKKEYQIKQNKAIAAQVQEEIRTILANNPKGTYATYEVLKAAYEKYEKLTEAQKAFIKDDEAISKLSSLVSVARNDYDNFSVTKETERKIRKIIEEMKESTEDTRIQQITLIKSYYEALSTAQKSYFSQDLLIFVNFWQNSTTTQPDEQETTHMQISKPFVFLKQKANGILTKVREKMQKK